MFWFKLMLQPVAQCDRHDLLCCEGRSDLDKYQETLDVKSHAVTQGTETQKRKAFAATEYSERWPPEWMEKLRWSLVKGGSKHSLIWKLLLMLV